MKPKVNHFAPAAEYFFREGCYITELDNDAQSPALSIARARLEPGKVTRWHRLTETNERYVVVSGIGTVEIGDECVQQIGPGDVAIIPAGYRQRIANFGSDDLVFLAICTPRFVPENYVDLEENN